MNIDEFIKSVTFPLSLLRLPVWLLDVDSLQIVWANDSALRLCDASDANDIQQANITFDLTCAKRDRWTHGSSKVSGIIDATTEFLTLYPDGKPVTYECTISAMDAPAGRRWLLVNGMRLASQAESESLFCHHALSHTLVCVSVYSVDGQLKYSNPAASRMLGADLTVLAERFQDEGVWQAIRASLLLGNEVRAEAKVATASGYAWHSLTLEMCPDPVLDESKILVTELDVSARRRAQEQVQQLAYHDVLTGLPNRASWYQILNTTLETQQNTGSVLFMDLDGFKAINDTYGHDVGDKLLIAVGMRVSDCLDEGEFLARLGGDEFTLLMDDNDDGALSAERARLILASLAIPIVIEEHELSIAPSIGISHFSADTTREAEQIMQQADLAMYSAKKAGGGFREYEPKMNEQLQHHQLIKRDLSLGRGPLKSLASKSTWVAQSVEAA